MALDDERSLEEQLIGVWALVDELGSVSHRLDEAARTAMLTLGIPMPRSGEETTEGKTAEEST